MLMQKNPDEGYIEEIQKDTAKGEKHTALECHEVATGEVTKCGPSEKT